MSINNPQINSFRSNFLLDTVSSRQANTDWSDLIGIGTYGWFGGGIDTAGPAPTLSNVDRVDFSNDSPTSTSSRGGLSTARYYLGGVANANYSWFAGGLGSSQIDRIDFSNDSPTTANVRGPLLLTRYALAATGNVNYGWFGGGFAPAVTSSVERINFANESPASASPRGPLSSARYALAATSNANYGWFGGGYAPAAPTARVSWVERVDFSNDSPTAASPRGLLSAARQGLSAISNTNYGWFVGGINPGSSVVSTVDRIDFSNDSPTSASARGPLATSVQIRGASGNANYGWFGGGRTSLAGTVVISAVDRIDFSNDSPATAGIRGPLSSIRGGLAGTSNYVKPLIVPRSATSINISTGLVVVSNASYGWFGGGNAPAATTVVSRIDFSNDSPTASSPRGGLSSARAELASTGNANFGWFAGGVAPAGVTTVDRIDYANDSPSTAGVRGPLSIARYGLAATSNANYGWFGGGVGIPFGVLSSVDRIDFSNDSPATASVRGTLSSYRYRLGATGNANYGWFAGGWPSPGYSTIDRIDYANDSPTSAGPRGPLSLARDSLAATGNANYGWFAGGTTNDLGGGAVSIVERVDYSNDSPTAASPRGLLSSPSRYILAATGNANYGWFAGGNNSAGGVLSTIDRIDFSNDSPTAASPRGLDVTRNSHSASSNYVKSSFPITIGNNINYGTLFGGNSYGWILGGQTITNVDRIDFSNDTATASLRGFSAASRTNGAATNNTNYGWIGGGIGPTPLSTVERTDFSNDSGTASTRGLLSQARPYLSATGNTNYGWFGGGYVPGPAVLSTVDRIDFANDSPATASPRGPLSLARQNLSAVSNANYGWFGGGYVFPTNYSVVDRIDFSNDSPTTANRRSQLTIAKYHTSSVSNNNYGWFTGGRSRSVPGAAIYYSDTGRLDFSNDTVTLVTRASLSNDLYIHVGVSNGNYGWLTAGISNSLPTSYSAVYRIDYSNDTNSATTRGPLASSTKSSTSGFSNYLSTTAIRQIGTGTTLASSGTTLALNINLGIPQYAKTVNPVGTGAGTYGWFAGGNTTPSITIYSTVDRIDFSNDSPTAASARGLLALARNNLAATSNASYGWFIGGGLARYSVVERIDYSNDSPTTASPRGSLTGPRYALVATGNASYGWVTGGIDNNSPSNYYTTVERIDYANDSSTTGVRGSLKFSKYIGAATGNANYGWFAGGLILPAPYASSLVERIDYSNDSPTGASTRGLLSFERFSHAATSNANYGWFAGGGTGAVTALTSIDRIDFANDSPASSSPRGPLSASRFGLSGSSNANYGWFGGGSGGYLAPPSPTVYSIVERIDYSNDSPTAASRRGPLSAARYSLGGSSNYVK